MQLLRCCFPPAILVLLLGTPCLAQDVLGEQHVTDILAEYKAKYPNGPADSNLCQRALGEHPPYSRMRLREVNPATLEKDLPALMQASDDVVLVGVDLRHAIVLTPSGEDALTYTDSRVLRVWKGSYKVGDLLTLGVWQGIIRCGADTKDFTGTQVGPVPISMFHTRNPSYAPDGPFVLFLQRDKTGEVETLRLTGGSGVQGMFDLRPPDIWDMHSPSSVCYSASYDRLACQDSYERSHGKAAPEWCRDPAVDLRNIAACNAFMINLKEPGVAFGVNQDPVREKYNGVPVASFLKEMQAAADSCRAPPSK
jgi:hypothetical protein